jgi:hypothetical protein
MKIISLILISMLLLCNLNAQNIRLDWAAQIGGSSYDYSNSIACDKNGNVYTVGSFYGIIDLYPGTGIYNLTSKGTSNDVFIQKLDSLGDFAWAKRIGGNSYEQINSIKIDNDGNVITTGNFSDTVDFDPGTNVNNLISSGGTEMFVQKLNSLGNFVWANRIERTANNTDPINCNGAAVAIDTFGNIYTTGEFEGTVDFDPGAGTYNLTSSFKINGPYANDIFIQKIDATGKFIWAKRIGGISSDYGYSIDVDGSGNVFATGFFEGIVDFDPGNGVYNLSSAGEADAFILKLNTLGDFIWAGQIGGSNYDYGMSIKVDSKGNSFISGSFGGGLSMEGGSADFSPGEGVYSLTSKGGSDIFLLKLDVAGNFVWVKQIGGTFFDTSRSLFLDNQNNIYLSGDFEGTVDFNPSTDTFNIVSFGEKDIFVQKLDATGNLIWTKRIGGSSYDAEPYISGDNSGSIYITANFKETADFDPNYNTFNLTSAGESDIFVQRMKPCMSTYSEITETANNQYSLNGIIYTNTGTFIQTISNSVGCDSIIKLYLTIENTQSVITKNDLGLNIHYYPNPSQGYVNIELTEKHDKVTISVLNSIGQEVSRSNFESMNSICLKMPNSPGLYFLRINTVKNVAVFKILNK